MKKTLLLLWVLPLFAGIGFAQTPLVEQFTALSQQIIDQAEDKNARLDALKELFTSCQITAKEKKIQDLCKIFLEKNFLSIDANNRTYEAEDLFVSLSGTKISVSHLWALSAAEVQQYIGIADRLSGEVLKGYGDKKARAYFARPEFSLVNFEDEGISFFIRWENTLSLEEIAKIRASLPENRYIDNPKYQEKIKLRQGLNVMMHPLLWTASAGVTEHKVPFSHYILGPHSRGKIIVWKYQLPENFPLETFEKNILWREGDNKKIKTIKGSSAYLKEIDEWKEKSVKSLKEKNENPLYEGSLFQKYNRVLPFGKNINQKIANGEVLVFTDKEYRNLYVVDKWTRLIYRIYVDSLPSAYLGNYTIDFNNPDGSSSFQLKK